MLFGWFWEKNERRVMAVSDTFRIFAPRMAQNGRF